MDDKHDFGIVNAALVLIGIFFLVMFIGIKALNHLLAIKIIPDGIGSVASLGVLLWIALFLSLWAIKDVLKSDPTPPVDHAPLPARGTPMGEKKELD